MMPPLRAALPCIPPALRRMRTRSEPQRFPAVPLACATNRRAALDARRASHQAYRARCAYSFASFARRRNVRRRWDRSCSCPLLIEQPCLTSHLHSVAPSNPQQLGMALRANRAYLLRIVDLEVVDPDWMPAAAMHLLFRHLDFEKLYAHDLSSKGATRRFRRPLPPLHLSANKPPAMAVQRLPPAEAR